MECPDGLHMCDNTVTLENADMKFLLLEKSIYRLIQSARQWWKKFTLILQEIDLKGGDVDPCFGHQQIGKDIVMIGIYVDDCILIGKDMELDKIIEKWIREGSLNDYLNLKIIENPNEGEVWIGQPNIVERLKKKIGMEVERMQHYSTLGSPHQVLECSKEDEELVTQEEATRYRLGVGLLLYLIKISRPDFSNATRELSKFIDFTKRSAYKEMKRVIKFVLDTAEWGLRMKVNVNEREQILCS